MKWASQLSEPPIAIDRSNLDGLPGSIVTLTRTGSLQASYLGSEPMLFKVPPLNLTALDFEKTKQELDELEKDIKAGIDFTDMSLINNAAEHDITVQLAVSSHLEPCSFSINKCDMPFDNEAKMCSISVSLKANTAMDQIQVHFHVDPPLKCSPPVQLYEAIEVNNVDRLDAYVYFEDNLPAPSAKVTAVVSFIDKKNIPRVIRKSDYLPLGLFCKLDNPQKEANNKITITVENADAPSLDVLYSEFLTEPSSLGVIGLKTYQSDSVVTVVSGKNTNRYRYLQIFDQFSNLKEPIKSNICILEFSQTI